MVSASRSDPLLVSHAGSARLRLSLRTGIEGLGPLRGALAVVVGLAAVWAILEPLPPATFTVLGLAAAVVGALALSALAVLRFEWFLWAILMIRPLVDLTKTGGKDANSGSGAVATAVGGAVILVGLLWIACLSHERRRLPMEFFSRALIALVASALISCAFSQRPVDSLLQVARTLGAVVIFLALEQLIRCRALALRALVVCLLSALGPLAVGMEQLARGRGIEIDGFSRIVGSFLHPNTFGFFLTLVILMAYAVRRYVPRPVRWALYLVMLVAGIELLFTYSRGSWIVLTLGLLLIGLLAERRLLIIIPAAAALLWLVVPGIRARLADLATAQSISGNAGNSASWRLAHISYLLSARRGDPLFGIGPKMADSLSDSGKAPHNDAVRLFLEGGVVGLTCYLVFLLALIALAVRGLRRLHTGLGRGLAVGFAACAAAFLADSMADNLITQFVLLIYVFGLAAVVQAWIRHVPDAEPIPLPSPPIDGDAVRADRAGIAASER